MTALADPTRYRLHFRKEGDLRWIGHHDLVRTVERLFRRLSLPLRLSQGYHPKPKFRFASALALGIAGQAEWVEVELTRQVDPSDLLEGLKAETPAGLVFTQVEPTIGKMPQIAWALYAIDLPATECARIGSEVKRLWQSTTWPVERKDRAEPVDVRQGLRAIDLSQGKLEFTVVAGRHGAIRPREVLKALGAEDLESHGAVLRRVAMIFADTEAANYSAEVAPDPSSEKPESDRLHPHVLQSLDEPTL